MDTSIPPAVRELCEQPLLAHISTVSPAGAPQSSIVWFELRDDEVVIFASVDTPKVRNLRQNPRIDVIVVDPERELGAGTPCYARLSGHAEVRATDHEIAHHLARRYGHQDGYPEAEFGKLGELVSIHVAVDRVSGLGPFGSRGVWTERQR